ncbi:hypothetical protein EV589_2796 [Mycobacterium sp. BK558]|nr:hypothetical protein EV589_2796 [Mycobacterium sp. BK558]
MVDRYRVWLGAGVLAGGVSAAMLAGAGVAAADDATSSGGQSRASSNEGRTDDAGTTASDEKADTASETKTNTTSSGNDDPKDDPKGEDAESAASEASEQDVEESAEKPPTKTSSNGGKHRAPEAQAPESEAADAETESEAPSTEQQAPDEEAPQPAAQPSGRHAVRAVQPSTYALSVDTDLGSPDGAAVMRLAAAQAPPVTPKPTLLEVLNNISTRFYNFYTDAIQFFAGPVRAPFGSTVRVETSTLTVGGRKEVPADWYFPDTDTPAGLIYLQHGFLANASFYRATAAYLAEKTSSVVVVPTLTWNLFDVDNYPLEWPTTGRAIADLFTGDRAALTASARTAGYDGELPTKVVLAGHSAGGGTVAMVGRYMAEAGNTDDLAGLVMFDGVGTLSFLSRDLAKIPLSVPVYNIAADPSPWNWYGDTNRKLDLVRPGMFTGVTIKGGHHADGMQTTAPIVQYFAYLAMGFSSPVDVMANRVLAAGWINDMLEGTRTAGVYNDNASTWDIVTGWWWGQMTKASTRRPHALAV